MTLVSVIVPCFNREDTVGEAVGSVLKQSWADLEVIAVDDGSTDSTWEVLTGMTDSRLRLVRNTGKGVSSARNFGVSLAKGGWISFQDSDDIWLPTKLKRQMDVLERGDYVAAYCGMQVKEDARPETSVQARLPDPGIQPLWGDIMPSLLKGSYLSTQMLVIRRDVFDRVGGFDEELQALVDWDLMLRVAQEGAVAFVDEDLVIQRMSANSITRSSLKRLKAQERILGKYNTLLAARPEVLGLHHHRLAGAFRMNGDYQKASKHAWASRQAMPFNLKYLLNALYLQGRALLF